MTQPATAPALPANVRVFEMAAAVVAARALWGAAELGVADALDNDPRPVDELAVTCGADPGALYRVLRLLAAHGVFVEHDGRRFSHSEMSRTLRSDHPTRTRAAVRMLSGDGMYRAFGAFRTSLATGSPSWDAAMGEPIFDWLSHEPEAAVDLQRRDDRHPRRRAASGRGGLSVRRHRDRRRRRLRAT